MSNHPLPITIELGQPLAFLAQRAAAVGWQQRLAGDLAALLARLGLAGDPVVVVAAGHSDRALQIEVHGRLQPYSPELMQRVWWMVVPPELRHLPAEEPDLYHPGYPDNWFTDYATNEAAGDGPELSLIFDYLGQLVLQVIQEQPGCLAGPAQVETCLVGETRLPAETMVPVMKQLLNFWLSLADRSLLLEAAAYEVTAGRSAAEVAETVYARLRPNRVEIHIHPTYLNRLRAGGSRPITEATPVYTTWLEEALTEPFQTAEGWLFYDFGAHVPELVWKPSAALAGGLVAVKINDRLRPPFACLQPGECFVSESLEQVQAMNVPCRPWPHPISGATGALVADSWQAQLEAAGLTVSTPLRYLTLVVYAELRAGKTAFFSLDDVQHHLAQLEMEFPLLVEVTYHRFSPADVTRVVRALVSEGITARYLKQILDRLLQYETLPVDLPQYVLFDDRLEVGEEMPPDLANSWPNYLAFVRAGLKYPVSFGCAGVENALGAIILDADSEMWLAERIAGNVGLNDDDRLRLLDTFWSALTPLVNTRPTIPVVTSTGQRAAVLVTTRLRGPLRAILAPELPNLPVIAYNELRHDTHIDLIERIYLDD